MTRPDQETLDRELARLVRRRGILVPAGASGEFSMHPDLDRRRRPIRKIPADFVKAWLASGAVEAGDGDSVVPTSSGAARVRRLTTETEKYAAQHHDFGARAEIDNDGALTTKRANLTHSPLAWLARRGGAGSGFLSNREFAAGERFYDDHFLATRDPATTSNWFSAPRSGGARGGRDPAGAPDAALAARDRVHAARVAMGAGLDRVVEEACLRAQSLETLERKFGWPRRSAKVVLKIALERLAEHYGLP